MKIAGIDASTTCSGIAINENGKLTFHDTINMKNNKNSEKRIMDMMGELGAFILDYSPDAVYIEDSWNKQNIETTKMLSNILGAVMYVCEENGIAFVKILPSVWRATVGISLTEGSRKLKREELKQAAIDRVARVHKIKCEDDEAEGICIADAGHILHTDNLFE